MNRPNLDSNDESLWHFKRTCKRCGTGWAGLHCPHDLIQNPCPECHLVPIPIEPDNCECAFDA